MNGCFKNRPNLSIKIFNKHLNMFILHIFDIFKTTRLSICRQNKTDCCFPRAAHCSLRRYYLGLFIWLLGMRYLQSKYIRAFFKFLHWNIWTYFSKILHKKQDNHNSSRIIQTIQMFTKFTIFEKPNQHTYT